LECALRYGKAPSPTDIEIFQKILAKERNEIASDYEKAMSRAVPFSRSRRAHLRAARGPSAAARRQWVANQVPTIWKYNSDDLSIVCNNRRADVKTFLADVVEKALALSFIEARPGISLSERSVEQLEASLLWMHSDCEGARGTSAFDYPEGALPIEMSMDNKLTCIPPSEEICPLASSLLRFMEPYREAVSALNGRIREIAISRGETAPVLRLRDKKDAWWLFAKSPSLEGTIYSVDLKVKKILEACDGRTPSGHIERSVLASDANAPAVKQAWRSLTSKGLVKFVWYP
jgi:hypothetical protein